MSRLSAFIRRGFRFRAHDSADFVRETLFEAMRREHLPQSTLFFTHQKCASTFVQRLLSRLEGSYGGLRVVDYSNVLWNHNARLKSPGPVDDIQLFDRLKHDLFCSRGFVYGPLRGGFSLAHDPRFSRVIFLRDPRDTLISMYYSMGWTHSIPPDPAWAEVFLTARAQVQRMTIDEFVVDHAQRWLKPVLAGYRDIVAKATGRLAVFRYEDLITRPEATVSSMLDVISGGAVGGPTVASALEGETFVRSHTVNDSHQRSGAAGQYRKELSALTIARLERIFAEEFDFFWSSGSGHLRRAA